MDHANERTGVRDCHFEQEPVKLDGSDGPRAADSSVLQARMELQ